MPGQVIGTVNVQINKQQSSTVQRDLVYKKMQDTLFGPCRTELMQQQKQRARTKLSKLTNIKAGSQ